MTCCWKINFGKVRATQAKKTHLTITRVTQDPSRTANCNLPASTSTRQSSPNSTATMRAESPSMRLMSPKAPKLSQVSRCLLATPVSTRPNLQTRSKGLTPKIMLTRCSPLLPHLRITQISSTWSSLRTSTPPHKCRTPCQSSDSLHLNPNISKSHFRPTTLYRIWFWVSSNSCKLMVSIRKLQPNATTILGCLPQPSSVSKCSAILLRHSKAASWESNRIWTVYWPTKR